MSYFGGVQNNNQDLPDIDISYHDIITISDDEDEIYILDGSDYESDYGNCLWKGNPPVMTNETYIVQRKKQYKTIPTMLHVVLNSVETSKKEPHESKELQELNQRLNEYDKELKAIEKRKEEVIQEMARLEERKEKLKKKKQRNISPRRMSMARRSIGNNFGTNHQGLGLDNYGDLALTYEIEQSPQAVVLSEISQNDFIMEESRETTPMSISIRGSSPINFADIPFEPTYEPEIPQHRIAYDLKNMQNQYKDLFYQPLIPDNDVKIPFMKKSKERDSNKATNSRIGWKSCSST
jgi:hypothetical protein